MRPCNLISSIYNDKHDIQPVNTVNRGAIASIPAESAVEVNCIITKDGPKPIAIGDLPVAVRGLVQQIKSFERVAAEAAVTGDYETALVAMTINPLVPSDDIAKQILDEMLEAHREHLPQFFKSVNVTHNGPFMGSFFMIAPYGNWRKKCMIRKNSMYGFKERTVGIWLQLV